jgi:hypothetical protein
LFFQKKKTINKEERNEQLIAATHFRINMCACLPMKLHNKTDKNRRKRKQNDNVCLFNDQVTIQLLPLKFAPA